MCLKRTMRSPSDSLYHLDVLVQGTASCAVSCKSLPAHVDVDRLHISHADICLSQVVTQCQITVEGSFLEATILHTVDMTPPSHSALAEQRVGLHIGEASTRQDINVGHVVLLYFHDHTCQPCDVFREKQYVKRKS